MVTPAELGASAAGIIVVDSGVAGVELTKAALSLRDRAKAGATVVVLAQQDDLDWLPVPLSLTGQSEGKANIVIPVANGHPVMHGLIEADCADWGAKGLVRAGKHVRPGKHGSVRALLWGIRRRVMTWLSSRLGLVASLSVNLP
jgi:hypothetical protein